MHILLTMAGIILVLTACGGGRSSGIMPPDIQSGPPELFSLSRNSNQYSRSGIPASAALQPQHSPIYHDSREYVFVGLDRPQSNFSALPLTSQQAIRFGALNDGTPKGTLGLYFLHNTPKRFEVAPVLKFVGEPPAQGDVIRTWPQFR